eukprot:Hpha_TRINITY_DN36239_c0_g1::TRINITY_DN36239_c0_g1_i1::g.83280::m.83280
MGRRKKGLISDSGKRERVLHPGDAFRRQAKKRAGARRKEHKEEQRLFREVERDPGAMVRKLEALERRDRSGELGAKEVTRMKTARAILAANFPTATREDGPPVPSGSGSTAVPVRLLGPDGLPLNDDSLSSSSDDDDDDAPPPPP